MTSRFELALLGREPLLIAPEILNRFVAGILDSLDELLGEVPEPKVENGIGVIPIKGPIGKNLTPIEKRFGAVDVEDISFALELMESSDDVGAILLDIDSPGGTVTGVPEVAERIHNLSKPSASFTSSLAASAAYWMGSATDHFYATPSASVGSVGVFMPVLDSSLAFARAGLQMQVIRSGKFKGMGLPGTTMSDEEVALLQERVDQIHADFKASVKRKRVFAQDESMEGQVFFGREAVARNLATSLVESREKLLSQLTREL